MVASASATRGGGWGWGMGDSVGFRSKVLSDASPESTTCIYYLPSIYIDTHALMHSKYYLDTEYFSGGWPYGSVCACL